MHSFQIQRFNRHVLRLIKYTTINQFSKINKPLAIYSSSRKGNWYGKLYEATYQKQGMTTTTDGKTVHVNINIKLASCYLKILQQILLRCISNLMFILSNPMGKPSAMPSWHCAACPSSFLFLFLSTWSICKSVYFYEETFGINRTNILAAFSHHSLWIMCYCPGFSFFEWSSQICWPESLHWIIR